MTVPPAQSPVSKNAPTAPDERTKQERPASPSLDTQSFILFTRHAPCHRKPG